MGPKCTENMKYEDILHLKLSHLIICINQKIPFAAVKYLNKNKKHPGLNEIIIFYLKFSKNSIYYDKLGKVRTWTKGSYEVRT